MKVNVLDIQGNKKKEIETNIFDNKIREDIIQKVVEAEKVKQPYSNFYLAGKQASATGKIRHGRRRWKTAAGKGISRVPRKIFWRRGTQFYWEGATISGARKGRRAHPPKVPGMINTKKINKKEKRIAFLSSIALTASLDDIKKKYQTLNNKNIGFKFPVIVEDKITDLKTKETISCLKKILGEAFEVSMQKKSIRAGKGKMRGRRYKKSAGALIITNKEDKKKIKGLCIKRADEVNTSDLASNGARITIYTEKAIKELEERLSGKNNIAAKKTIKQNKSHKKAEEKKK